MHKSAYNKRENRMRNKLIVNACVLFVKEICQVLFVQTTIANLRLFF